MYSIKRQLESMVDEPDAIIIVENILYDLIVYANALEKSGQHDIGQAIYVIISKGLVQQW